MKIAPITTTLGVINEPIWNVNDFEYDLLIPEWEKSRSKKNIVFYCTNFFATFDIETTTIYDRDPEGKPINAQAWLYQWQFCINSKVIFGRTWDEFTLLIQKLQEFIGIDEDHYLICYVHNLSYEFQFMKDFLNWIDIFARAPHKPLRAKCIEGIEFRCSYILSNMNLAKFCANEKNVIHCKNVGVYDYEKIRTPKTELTETEESYCYNDVRGLYECIESRLQDDTLLTIPMTSTGYVRRAVRDAMAEDKKQLRIVHDIKLTARIYELLKKAFRGGDTHANYNWILETLEDIDSFDLASSYPWAMMSEKYPMTSFIKTDPANFTNWINRENDFALLFVCKMENVKYKGSCGTPYISFSKCELVESPVCDNGRVWSADSIICALTEIDFRIIQETYSCENFAVSELYVSKKEWLPYPIRQCILQFFLDKTMLKNVKEYEYMKSKNRLNGIYGMMVTDILQDIVSYNGEWKKERPNIEEAIEKDNKSRKRFTAYQWGVWVTAYARRNLHRGREPIGRDQIYSDTDSNKTFIGHRAFYEELNKEIKERAEHLPIPPIVTRDGKKYYMGIWEHDAHYLQFRTAGAKKYVYKKDDGRLGVTVAGLAKSAGVAKLEKMGGDLDNFTIGLEFNPSGNSTAFYNDCEPHKIEINENCFLTASNLALVPTSYLLGITNEYRNFLKNFK